MTDSYPIPAASAEFTETIKKSQFITLIDRTDGIAQARQFIDSCRNAHPQARHHCWAYIAGAPDDPVKRGFSDDGEPSGTAGKPMLAQLDGSGIGQVCAVVVRYSGGIKLGTGGLVKAYGGGVKQALTTLDTVLFHRRVQWTIEVPFEDIGSIEQFAGQDDVSILERAFNARAGFTLAVNASTAEHRQQELIELTQGKVRFIEPRA
ncbi:YigZ family protein [Aestuariibacter halophilus]|uniref:YigZ family protein n=1 Tax=Fluctibacter halophilus TaxID=226011 RepID=A0ABS8GAZ0_9ALTE|nr:YigZ family protein [Aestuariibacter halophilus]MCC2616396.1 YigZ family protein [Aestuariibacter halophilus]